MEAIRKGLDKVLEVVCCLLLALMTIFATWQVASRYIFNKPSTVTEELVLICFVWMGLLGAAYVFGKQEHMRMSQAEIMLCQRILRFWHHMYGHTDLFYRQVL